MIFVDIGQIECHYLAELKKRKITPFVGQFPHPIFPTKYLLCDKDVNLAFLCQLNLNVKNHMKNMAELFSFLHQFCQLGSEEVSERVYTTTRLIMLFYTAIFPDNFVPTACESVCSFHSLVVGSVFLLSTC